MTVVLLQISSRSSSCFGSCCSQSCSCYCAREHCLTLRTFLDVALLSERALAVVAAANALWQLGSFLPVFFISDYGLSRGLSTQRAALLVAFNGTWHRAV